MKKKHLALLAVIPIIMLALGIEGYFENKFSSKSQPSNIGEIISDLQPEENGMSPRELQILDALQTSSFELDHFSAAYSAMDEANSALLRLVFWLSILQFIAISHVYTKSKPQPVVVRQ